MTDNTWNRNEWDQAGVTPRVFRRAEEALSYINSVSLHLISYPQNFKMLKYTLAKVMMVSSYLNG